MKLFSFIFLILFSFLANSNEIEVIELHENKSLDQMVMDQIETDLDDNIQNDITTVEPSENNQDLNIDDVEETSSIIITNNSWENIDSDFVDKVLKNALNINSLTLQKEFNNYLLNLNLDYSLKKNRDIFYLVVNYFYKIGDLPNSFNLIKSRDINNDENILFYNLIEMNYLLSTFKLEQVCSFKDQLSQNINLTYNFIDKIEIFCLVLQNKLSEAQLLNSIMQETEIKKDENFQTLFLYLYDQDYINNSDTFSFSEKINSDLIFLYSAMARIAELPLNQKFLDVDSTNMAIPIILNKSSPKELRIKAANQSFINKTISIDSLAALYQSVDFDSSQFDNPKQTIEELSNNVEIIMSFYFQLINIQIFPSERLEALISFWNFAKTNNLEEIAYSLTYKITDSIEITSDYLLESPQISTSYIYNGDYEKAVAWIDFYENANGIDDQSTFVKILLDLYTSENLDKILNTISENFDKLIDKDNYRNEELIYVLFEILDKKQDKNLKQNFNNVYDDRQMPSLFINENIINSIENKNDNDFLIYSIISLNNKNWNDIHPNHLKIILYGYLEYEKNDLIKKIILEIFKNYKIL